MAHGEITMKAKYHPSNSYEEFEDIRNQHGLTRKAFASMLGVSLRTYYSYRHERRPKLSVKLLAREIKKVDRFR